MRPRLIEFQDELPWLFPEESQGKAVRTVTLQVTDACNLRCSYCYQINKANHYLDPKLACDFLELLLTDRSDYINRENTAGIVLDLIGGEPFLAIEAIDEIVRWFILRMIELNHPWLYRFRISISSNGTVYFDPKVQAFLDRYRPWVSLTISIDGNRELHDACRLYPDGTGSYDDTITGALDWLKRNGRVGSKLTLSPENVGFLSDAVRNLIELGYVQVMANCAYEEGWTLEHAARYYHQLVELTDWLEVEGKLDSVYVSLFDEFACCPVGPDYDQNWCGGTGSMIAVDHKGDIFPCLRYMESSLGNDVPPVIIGTVNGGIAATEKQRSTIDRFSCVTWQSQSSDECYRCPIGRGCAWCSAFNYQCFGNVNRRATFICEMHKARSLANVYFWIRYNRFMGIAEPVINHVPDEWAIPIIGQRELDRLKALLAEDKCRIETIHANAPTSQVETEKDG